MGKLKYGVLIVLIGYVTSGQASNNPCGRLLSMYGLHREIKSIKGWKRVVHNNKLHLYTNGVYIELKNKPRVVQCLLTDSITHRKGL